MVVSVCRRARESGATSIAVATDDARIVHAVEQHGFRALVTSPTHASGTDRIAEAARTLGLVSQELIVNVQGDEPRIQPDLIRAVADMLEHRPEASMSTACHMVTDAELLSNPNVVKVVLDAQGHALYFSRSRIPYPRESGGQWYRHAGIYGFRAEFLQKYQTLPQSPLEKTESLEQLRVLWHGYKIAVVVREDEAEASVDSPQDLIHLITVKKL